MHIAMHDTHFSCNDYVLKANTEVIYSFCKMQTSLHHVISLGMRLNMLCTCVFLAILTRILG